MDDQTTAGIEARIMRYFKDSLGSIGDGEIVELSFEQIERSKVVGKGLDRCPAQFREERLRTALGNLVNGEKIYGFKGAYVYYPYGGSNH